MMVCLRKLKKSLWDSNLEGFGFSYLNSDAEIAEKVN